MGARASCAGADGPALLCTQGLLTDGVRREWQWVEKTQHCLYEACGLLQYLSHHVAYFQSMGGYCSG